MRRILVGLGNPGARYARTRHNVGFRVLDRFAEREGLSWSAWHRKAWAAEWGEKALLLKPTTYMNLSGEVLESAERLGGAAPSDVLVVVDDVALDFGVLRLRAAGSHGGHNGLRDIERALGTSEYPRLRLGVGKPAGGAGELKEFVLAEFEASEEPRVEAMVERAVQLVREFLNGESVGRLTARFNGAVTVSSDTPRTSEE